MYITKDLCEVCEKIATDAVDADAEFVEKHFSGKFAFMVTYMNMEVFVR